MNRNSININDRHYAEVLNYNVNVYALCDRRVGFYRNRNKLFKVFLSLRKIDLKPI